MNVCKDDLMQKFIPIFPLNMVAFPGEELNLHIFEPRYKQLITECRDDQKTFGIPVVDNNNILEHGTEMELVHIHKVYPDGEMDIRVRGLQAFRLLEVVREVPDKLYSGAIISVLPNVEDKHSRLQLELEELTVELFTLLDIRENLEKKDFSFTSFRLGHYIGFSLREEYELLRHVRETERQKLCVEHIKRILPAVRQVAEIRDRAKWNGQYRMINPPDFL